MYYDTMAGRPTEHDAIHGAALRKAAEHRTRAREQRTRSDPPAERTTRSRYAAPHGRDRTLQYLGR